MFEIYPEKFQTAVEYTTDSDGAMGSNPVHGGISLS